MFYAIKQQVKPFWAVSIIALSLPLASLALETEETATPALLATTEASEEAPYSDEFSVTVSALRRDEKLKNTSRAMTLLTQKRLRELKPRSTPEALIGATGVMMQTTNYGGGSPYLRGMIGQQVLVLVDGVRLNNSTFRYGPNQYLNTIDHWTIDRIEIIRGPGSVQYGPDAIGGVINIITEQPSLDFPHDETGVGGFMAFRLDSASWGRNSRVKLNGNIGDFAFQGGVSIKYFDNLRGGKDTAPETGGEQAFTGYSEYDFDLASRFYLTQKTYLNASYAGVRQVDVPITHESSPKDFTVYEKQNRDLFALRLVSRWGAQDTEGVNATFSYQNQYEKKSRARIASIGAPPKTEINTIDVGTIGFAADYHSKPIDWLKYNLGGDIYYDMVDSEREFSEEYGLRSRTMPRGAFISNSNYLLGGLFLELDATPFKGFHIIPSGRFFFSKANVPSIGGITAYDSSSSNYYPGLEYNEKGVIGGLGLQYFILDDLQVNIGIYQGFRTPNLDDFSSLSKVDGKIYEIPNNEIEPEKALSTELGAKYFGDFIAVQLAGYFTRLTDLIARDFTTVNGQEANNLGEYYVHKTNIGKANILGLETEISAKIIYGFSAYANLTYTYGMRIEDEGGLKGATCEETVAKIGDPEDRKAAAKTCSDDALRRIPPLFGAFGLKYAYQNMVRAELAAIWAARQSRLAPGDIGDPRIPYDGTKGYIVPFIGAEYSPIEFFNVGFKFINPFDTTYRTHGSGVDAPGRSVNLDVSVEF